jgi:hypothetical protein
MRVMYIAAFEYDGPSGDDIDERLICDSHYRYNSALGHAFPGRPYNHRRVARAVAVAE